MLEELHSRLDGKVVVILGVGNPVCGDDGIGPSLADRLHGKINATIVNAGDVPENYLGPVIAARPEVVVIVDAAELGAAPGDMAIIEVNDLKGNTLSTHITSLSLVAKAIQSGIQTDVFLLGVQPASTTFGAPMSKPVVAALHLLEDIFLHCTLKTNPSQ